MIKKRIFTLILFLMIVAFCMAEALVIRELKGKEADLEGRITELEDAASSHNTDIARLKSDVGNKVDRVDPSVVLPKDIFVCAGMTIEIYNENICTNVNLDDYSFFWDCNVGDCMEDRLRIHPSAEETGDHPVTLTVCDESMIEVANAQTTVHVVKNVFATDTVSGASIVTIGDSLSAGTEWLRYTREISGDKISHLGKVGDEENLRYEAIPGISAAEMYAGKLYGGDAPNSFTNPDTGVFDWDYYVRTNGIHPDCVNVFLGMNGLDIDPDANADSIFAIVDNIKNCDPDIQILLTTPIFPGDQNAMAMQQNIPGYEAFHGMNSAERRLMIANLVREIEARVGNYDNVTLVPAALVFDTQKGFNLTIDPANPHTDATNVYASEGVHPGAAGYRQIGDEIYSALCYLIENGKVSGIKPPAANEEADIEIDLVNPSDENAQDDAGAEEPAQTEETNETDAADSLNVGVSAE